MYVRYPEPEEQRNVSSARLGVLGVWKMVFELEFLFQAGIDFTFERERKFDFKLKSEFAFEIAVDLEFE